MKNYLSLNQISWFLQHPYNFNLKHQFWIHFNEIDVRTTNLYDSNINDHNIEWFPTLTVSELINMIPSTITTKFGKLSLKINNKGVHYVNSGLRQFIKKSTSQLIFNDGDLIDCLYKAYKYFIESTDENIQCIFIAKDGKIFDKTQELEYKSYNEHT